MPVLTKGRAEGIPLRYMGDVPDQVVKNMQGLMDSAGTFLKGEDVGWAGAILHGKLGRGKSSAAIEVMRLFEANGYASLFITVYDMVAQLKTSWGTDLGEIEAAKRFIKPALLVVDEVGVQFDTEAERNLLYSIIVTRHNMCLPTIMTTNHDLGSDYGKEQFAISVGSRIANRFDDVLIDATKWGGNIRIPKLGF
jgi:DNA replication protein DnaC